MLESINSSEWLSHRDNWMLDTFGNKTLEMLDCAIQRDILSEMQHCSFFELTASGTAVPIVRNSHAVCGFKYDSTEHYFQASRTLFSV